jgi:fluoride exporter
MVTILLVMTGGALGAVLRYLTTLGTVRLLTQSHVVTGTVCANIIGCFLAGFLFALFQESGLSDSHYASFLTIGMLGSYTTLSTFSLELFQRLTDSIKNLALYLFMQLVAALGSVLMGYYLFQLVTGGLTG